jgi:Fe2+ transport system protein B
VAVLGKLLGRRYPEDVRGMVLEIPPYRLPAWPACWRETWARTSDILTIVTPLLVGGSVVLALLAHVGADDRRQPAAHAGHVMVAGPAGRRSACRSCSASCARSCRC